VIDRFKLEDESSLLNWYPKIKDRLLTPETEILKIDREDQNKLYGALDGNDIPNDLINKIQNSADKIRYPLFLRSDQGSGKHNWKDTCYVPDRDSLIGHIINLIEWHTCAGILGLQWEALVFREFLQLESIFTAFWGSMPVSRERRVFVRDGKVECMHPYWPIAAIREDRANPLPENWKEQLEELNHSSFTELHLLEQMAMIFSSTIPGYWSVDFACDVNGSWFLIDAARGEISWHDEDCPHCPEDQKQKPKPLKENSLLVDLLESGTGVD